MTRSANPHPTMRDWLAMHRLTASGCRSLLARPGGRMPPAPGPRRTGLDGPQAWGAVADALARAMPDLGPEIGRARSEIRTALGVDPARHPRAMTLRDAGTGVPMVVAPIHGTGADLIVLAHEFGHALNYMLTPDADPPPILRETCALLCETLAARDLPQEPARIVRPILARRHARQTGPAREAVLAVLDAPEAAYDYAWNYPPARALADRLAADPDGARLSDLFRGRLTVSDLATD